MIMKEEVAQLVREPLLSISALDVELTARTGKAYILKDINFEVRAGETICLVGESGCGKSMTALAVMKLMPEKVSIPTGAIYLHGEDLAQYDAAEMSRIRGNKISMIFQEPMTALNPVYTVGDQISEPLRRHQGMSRAQARAKTVEILQSVGIPAPEQRIDNYPHEMSGGMRQRVMIAMAMACDPDVLIADEPTTALDVTVQAQIFDLLREQQARRGTAIVMITHDMGAVAEMSDRVVVMYGGRVVEEGLTDEVLSTPCHPYTKGLIACLPELDPAPTDERPDLPEIAGVVPSIWERGKGCPFVDRCSVALDKCGVAFPPSFKIASSQSVACWLYGEQA
ncbi:ABC transporter ATP-binding protein [Paenalcaligenes sp. Me131]|uniref:ABC transporter ATP-binding protein n=1 Tax=Paenalcaligenes sp. Me131 TaxID=3392636 RepID=UPI003D2AFFA2